MGFKVTPVLQADTLGVWNELETINFIDDTVRFNPAVGEIEQLYTTAVALSRPMGDREQKIVILGTRIVSATWNSLNPVKKSSLVIST